MKKLFAILSFSLLAIAAEAQYYQQCPKWVPGGLTGTSYSGRSVATSADATTIITGAPGIAGAAGAAVICNRTGSIWTQGQILKGTGAVFGANQGQSVAISADGNTAVVGGPSDDVNAGAVWIFVRSGGVWSQQGSKLIGTGATGKAFQGYSVAISGDGNTIIFGGPNDNSNVGAAWVFTRSGSTWTQFGTKLLGTGSLGVANQGSAVALSFDGSTAIVGAINGHNPGGYTVGGACIYALSSGAYTQQEYLYYVGSAGSYMGASVDLSSDGNTAIFGAPGALGKAGGAIVAVRSAGVWTQQGPMLTGTLPVGNAQQGESVALTADGNTAVIGGGAFLLPAGTADIGTGAAWIFKRSGSTWTQYIPKFVGTGAVGNSQQGASVAIANDGTYFAGGPGDDGNKGAVWVATETIPVTSTPPSTYVSTLSVDNKIKCYPNPATDEIFIDLGQTLNETVNLTIIDQLGRVCSSVKIDGKEQVYPADLSNLPHGIFILQVATETAGVQKFIFVKK